MNDMTRDLSGKVRFRTAEGVPVPSITAEQMREVDRLAMEDFGLGILQMMENAGRNLAELTIDLLNGTEGNVVVLAGGGGNGGGGLCCARHLHNRGFDAELVLDRDAAALTGAAATQWQILQAAGVRPLDPDQVEAALRTADLAIDALIGYSLRGAARGRAAELITLCNEDAAQVLALDVPSGLNATTGETPGVVIRADRVLTLALPKTGLRKVSGTIYLADIGIPPEVYARIGVSLDRIFGRTYWLELERYDGFEPVREGRQ
jgi:NAD(P)H-hydrate epimerase